MIEAMTNPEALAPCPASDDDMIPVRRGLIGAVNYILKRSGYAGSAPAKEFIPLAMSQPAPSPDVAKIVAWLREMAKGYGYGDQVLGWLSARKFADAIERGDWK